MSQALSFFATTAKGLEAVLAAEIGALGARHVAPSRAGVAFSGRLELAYRACLWSRVASRILLPLGSFPANTPEALYDGVRTIPWSDHIDPRHTLAVDFTTSHSRITHSHFGALKTKDAIVDQMRDRSGQRPSIALVRPHLRVNVYLQNDRATVSIDLSGESLHRRSYRHHGVAAPLKENLAAGILLLANWPPLARAGTPFVDPMCGSGTLPIEAAMIAADMAPGRRRTYFGFLGWRGHQPAIWKNLLREADARALRDQKQLPPIHGYDGDTAAVRTALTNVERTGLRAAIHIERRALAASQPIGTRIRADTQGVLVTNPPYGERLGNRAALADLYATLGDILRRKFLGWRAYVLTGSADLAKQIGLRAARRHIVYNGAIECRLLEFPISTDAVQMERGPRWRNSIPPAIAAKSDQ